MNKQELELLADIRIREAELLLSAQRYSGAYYLAGYSLECLLKACIAKQIKRHDFPDKKLALDSYTHDLERLCITAGLKPSLKIKEEADEGFKLNWSVAMKWDVESRYDYAIDRQAAEDLVNAINDPVSGVFQWLKSCL
jgi:HEPN domain-containing protein